MHSHEIYSDNPTHVQIDFSYKKENGKPQQCEFTLDIIWGDDRVGLGIIRLGVIVVRGMGWIATNARRCAGTQEAKRIDRESGRY